MGVFPRRDGRWRVVAESVDACGLQGRAARGDGLYKRDEEVMKLPNCITVIIMTLLPLLAPADATDCTAARACPMLAVASGARFEKIRKMRRQKAQETLTPQEFEKWCQEEDWYDQRVLFVIKCGVGFCLFCIWVVSISHVKKKKNRKRKNR